MCHIVDQRSEIFQFESSRIVESPTVFFVHLTLYLFKNWANLFKDTKKAKRQRTKEGSRQRRKREENESDRKPMGAKNKKGELARKRGGKLENVGRGKNRKNTTKKP